MCGRTLRGKSLTVQLYLTSPVVRNMPACNLSQFISWAGTRWSHPLTSGGQKMGTFSSTGVFSFSATPFPRHFFYRTIYVCSFSKTPYWLIDNVPSPWLDVQDSLKSGFQNFTKHPLYPFIGYYNPAKKNCLKSSQLLLSSPLQTYAHVLSSSCMETLLKLQLYVNSQRKHSLRMPAGWSSFIL